MSETHYAWIDGERVEISQEEFEAGLPDPVTPYVPTSITLRQAKLQLSRAGILGAVDQFIAAMEGQDGEEARIEWEYATELRRDHPLVAALGPEFNLSDEAIDNLFIEAATIA